MSGACAKQFGVALAAVVLMGCEWFLGPETPVSVPITFDDAILQSNTGMGSEWSHTVIVSTNNIEKALVIGESVVLDCTTWQWVKFAIRVVEDDPVVDDVGYRETAIRGKDIRDQSPYSIVREVTVTESGGNPGSAVWLFEFSLSSTDV